MDDEDEDYVVFGTPLPEMEDEATLKKKAAREFQVRDEKGRQRFHGAFTGGFSAGYFNTVGTKEGWTPSTFVSSRNKVADRIQQNPEDFMDDEDFSVFGIATRKIHTTTNFQDTSDRSSQKRNYIDTDAVIPGEAPLKDIVQPVRESIGIAILRQLGWREGQGIGPRVKKPSKGPKVYGCSPFPDTASPESCEEEDDDPMAALFTFAPKDVETMSFKSKENYFGLGYTGLSKQSVLTVPVDPFATTSTKSWLPKDKKKLKISGQAFGVGAYEDEDEDIYRKDDMSQYDFSDLELKTQGSSQKAIELAKPASSQGIIEGFCLASQPPSVKKYYPPPPLPADFKPVHLKTARSIPQKLNSKQSHHLSSSDRSLLLGERKFEKVSLNEEKKTSRFEQIEFHSSSSTLSLADLSKQHRYENYLKLKKAGDLSKFVQPSSMTEWEKQQELEEFAQTAARFKPLSNALSSRFECQSQLDVQHEVMDALEKIKKEKAEKEVKVKKNLIGMKNRETFEWHPTSLLCKRMNVPNPYPDLSSSGSSGTQKSFQSKSVFDHLIFAPEKSQDSEKSEVVSDPVRESQNKTSESNKDISSETQKEVITDSTPVKLNEEPVGDKRPPMDFFKDIFENSSSDEDVADEDKTETSEITVPEPNIAEDTPAEESFLSSTNKKIAEEICPKQVQNNSVSQNSSMGNKKVGFGVFANLDLDALNRRKPVEKPLHLDCVIKSKEKEVNNAVSSDAVESKIKDTYGPELPPDYSIADTPVLEITPSKGSSKKHSKSKSSRKHKHKHKHKKKKKKNSRRKSTSTDSSEEEVDDIPPSLIIEKLKQLQKKKS